MDVNGIDLPIADAGAGLKYIQDRNKKAASNGNVTHTVTAAEPVHTLGDHLPESSKKEPTESATEPEPVETKASGTKTGEKWTDPETGEEHDGKPTRYQNRLSKLWQRGESERQMREAAERRLSDVEARLAERDAGRSTSSAQPAATDDDALTVAAQARIRAKPDRAAIGTTYPTYEDFVEDCAIWGGELAAEKRQLRAEDLNAQTAMTAAQTVFATERAQAKATHDDFDEVTLQDLPVNQAIWDATVNAPQGLKGHVLYWLGKHADETARIAKLPPGPALVAMGEVIAAVRAEQKGTTPKQKPQSDAPPPPEPLKGSASKDTPLHKVTDPGASKVNAAEWIKSRNAEVGSRRRF